MLSLLFGALAILILGALAMGLAFPKGSNLYTTIGMGLTALGSVTGTQTLDPSVSNGWTLTATGNITLTAVQGFVPGQFYFLDFTQDGVGGKTLSVSGITVTMMNGTSIAPTATANLRTTYVFWARSATDLYCCSKV